MPAFRNGLVRVDPRLNGEALGALRNVGHGRRLNVVDRSYDVPDGERRVTFPGSSADALFSIVRVIPVEGDAATYMRADREPGKAVNYAAAANFEDVVHRLASQGRGPFPVDLELEPRYRTDVEEMAATGLPGFYSLANAGDESRLYVVTIDSLPFACASFIVGHSQRGNTYA